ncbi:uncharacterized protein LOC105665072 [Ceratitis capitata]|uniref:uncharacterized protein LOC105665072 n=1 Tax=Ceratitis capitata TaxID=7213 RepID=UPI000618852B|nr:uncharacterized protein LOC105665072 [Ceratitis capitata]
MRVTLAEFNLNYLNLSSAHDNTRNSKSIKEKVMDFNAIIILVLLSAVIVTQPCPMGDATTTKSIMKMERVKFYQKFMAKIWAEERFESCLLYGDLQASETLQIFLQILFEDLSTPILLQTTNSSFQIANIFNRNVLSLVRLEDFERELPKIGATLELLRQKRIILIGGEQQVTNADDQYLTKLFRLCETKKMLNVLVVDGDFWQTETYYSYTIFPHFRLERKHLETWNDLVFPPRLSNLHGYGIRTLPDLTAAWTFLYLQDGRVKVGGYLSCLLTIFAETINATLIYPMQVRVGEIINSTTIDNFMQNNLLDIPMKHIFLETANTIDMSSRPYGISDICIVAPVVWYHSVTDFLLTYFDGKFSALIFISYFTTIILLHLCIRLRRLRAGRPLHGCILASYLEPSYMAFNYGPAQPRGVQSLVTLKILISLSLVWFLCIQTHYAANLKTFVTKPVEMPVPKSWEDLNNVGIKVMMSRHFYSYKRFWCYESCARYERFLKISESQEITRKYMESLNTSYAYPTDLFTWHFIKFNMRSLSQRVFRWTDICLKRQTLQGFLLPPNSAFKDSLDLFLTRIADSGLANHWIEVTYAEAVRLKKINKLAFANRDWTQPIGMKSISFMWSMFAFGWTIALAVFICEIALAHWKKPLTRRNK